MALKAGEPVDLEGRGSNSMQQKDGNLGLQCLMFSEVKLDVKKGSTKNGHQAAFCLHSSSYRNLPESALL